jgi:hypothetical protein
MLHEFTEEAIDVRCPRFDREQMRLTSGTLAFVFGCVVVASAQGTSTQAPAGNKPAAANAPHKMTVTGCLQRAQQASTPATGTTGAPRVVPEAFVLINSTAGEKEKQPADVTTYVVAGPDLASKVGQRVEVTGMMTLVATPLGTTPPSERHEAGTVAAETPGSVSPAAAESTPHIQVTSIRGVAGDCSVSNR